jgi:hypothetical protein
MTIDFISAENGGIRLYDTDAKKTFWSDSVDGLADILRNRGIGGVAHSSSMDFAAEDGFANDDGAWVLFRHALEGWRAWENAWPDEDTDREKFDAWIKACPVPILKVEVHVRLPDEDDD